MALDAAGQRLKTMPLRATPAKRLSFSIVSLSRLFLKFSYIDF